MSIRLILAFLISLLFATAFGKYYIRIADEDRELSPSELRKIMIRREYEENWENSARSPVYWINVPVSMLPARA